MSEGRILFERRSGAGWITLSRPERLNSLASDMREQLRFQIVAATEDDEIESLVITGAGSAFCAGGDIDHMADLSRDGDESGFRRLLDEGVQVVHALQDFPGRTIAAVNGVAAGAGLALALSCDLRIATPATRLGATWGKIGLVPDWGASYLLPQVVGAAAALELVTTCKLVEAKEAESMGLVSEVVAEEELQARAQELATSPGADAVARIGSKRRISAESRDNLLRALEREVEEQVLCFHSREFADGLRTFLERREKRPER